MADTPFATAAKAAVQSIFSLHGETVTYARGSIDCELTAYRVQKAVDLEVTEGVYARAMEVVWTFLATDGDFDSVMEDPQRGDTITDEAGNVFDYASTEAEYLVETGEWVVPTQRLDP